MPDWYIRRHEEGDFPWPYSVRLGGCEYSLTHEQWAELATAFRRVDAGEVSKVESDEYQELKMDNEARQNPDKPSLLDILNLKPKATINRRGM